MKIRDRLNMLKADLRYIFSAPIGREENGRRKVPKDVERSERKTDNFFPSVSKSEIHSKSQGVKKPKGLENFRLERRPRAITGKGRSGF